MNAPMPPQHGGYDPNGPQTPQDAKARAKAEKAYRKAQRPFYKKKRFILPALFLLLIVVIAATAGGGDKTSTAGSATGSSAGGSASGGTPCAADYADKQPKDVCADANGTVTLQGLAAEEHRQRVRQQIAVQRDRAQERQRREPGLQRPRLQDPDPEW